MRFRGELTSTWKTVLLGEGSTGRVLLGHNKNISFRPYFLLDLDLPRISIPHGRVQPRIPITLHVSESIIPAAMGASAGVHPVTRSTVPSDKLRRPGVSLLQLLVLGLVKLELLYHLLELPVRSQHRIPLPAEGFPHQGIGRPPLLFIVVDALEYLNHIAHPVHLVHRLEFSGLDGGEVGSQGTVLVAPLPLMLACCACCWAPIAPLHYTTIDMITNKPKPQLPNCCILRQKD